MSVERGDLCGHGVGLVRIAGAEKVLRECDGAGGGVWRGCGGAASEHSHLASELFKLALEHQVLGLEVGKAHLEVLVAALNSVLLGLEGLDLHALALTG